MSYTTGGGRGGYSQGPSRPKRRMLKPPGSKAPGGTYAGAGDGTFEQFMQQAQGGRYGQGLGPGGRDAFKNSPGLQGAAAATDDYDKTVDLANRENMERQQIRDDLKGFIDETGQARDSRTADFLERSDTESQGLKDLADKNKASFEAFQDKNKAGMEKYLKAGISAGEKALENYESQSLASVSAAASGIQQSVESQIQELQNSMGNVTGGTQEVAQQTAMLRNRGMQQMQTQVSGLIDERNKIKLSARMQLGGMNLQAGGIMGDFSSRQEGQRGQRMADQERLHQAASTMATDARLSAMQADMSYRQMELGGYNQLANVMKDLPFQHVSLFDAIMAANMSLTQGEVNMPFNQGGASGTYNPFTETPFTNLFGKNNAGQGFGPGGGVGGQQMNAPGPGNFGHPGLRRRG